jgi:hypothetical protein
VGAVEDYVEAQAGSSAEQGELLRRWMLWTFGAGHRYASRNWRLACCASTRAVASPAICTPQPGAITMQRSRACCSMRAPIRATANRCTTLPKRPTTHACACYSAGARVGGSNALMRTLDCERPQTLHLMLAHGGDPNERGPHGCPLTHAIRRRRSPETVRILLARSPGLIERLSDEQLRLLPELAAEGCGDAVQLMVESGWPIAVRGGDINGSALNHAVFRGDSALAAFLLAHGAHYDERHGYDDNVYGTLSFASRNEIASSGDWLGCAKALVASGAPLPETRYVFADDVAEYFADLRTAA